MLQAHLLEVHEKISTSKILGPEPEAGELSTPRRHSSLGHEIVLHVKVAACFHFCFYMLLGRFCSHWTK